MSQIVKEVIGMTKRSSTPFESRLEQCYTKLSSLMSGHEKLAVNQSHRHKARPKNNAQLVDKNLSYIDLKRQDIDNLNIIHVAGTKGKGSVCSYTESILRAHGYKTGLFTSPHLKTVRERIQINGEPISEELFVKYFEKVWEQLPTELHQKLGHGAFLTLLSFVVFSQERTQVCVYEVLVGGKRDATNVVTKPIATGITKLGLDHTRTLGQGPYSTIHENIAWHKAGIFKSACPAFTIEQDAKFSGVVQSCAQETSTTLTIVKGDHFPQLHSVGRLKTEEQKQNASLAIMLAYSFLYPETSVLELTNTTRRGLEDCRLLGRSQTIVSGSCKWCLDVAHNPMSIQAAGRWFCNEQSRDGSALLIELHNVLENIQIDYAIFCTDDVWADGTTIQGSINRNVDPATLSDLTVQKSHATTWQTLRRVGSHTIVKRTIEEAVKEAENIGAATGSDIQTLITGSFYLVGGALHILQPDTD